MRLKRYRGLHNTESVTFPICVDWRWEECATFHFHFRVGAPDFPAVVPFSVADMLQVVRQQRIRESWAQ